MISSNKNNNPLHLSNKQLNHLTSQLAAAIGANGNNNNPVSPLSPSPTPPLDDQMQWGLKNQQQLSTAALQFSMQLQSASPVPSSVQAPPTAGGGDALCEHRRSPSASNQQNLFKQQQQPGNQLVTSNQLAKQAHDHTYNLPAPASAKCCSLTSASASASATPSKSTLSGKLEPLGQPLVPKRGPGRRPKQLQLQINHQAQMMTTKSSAALSRGAGISNSNNNHLKHNPSQQFFHNQSTSSQLSSKPTNNNHNNIIMDRNSISSHSGSAGKHSSSSSINSSNNNNSNYHQLDANFKSLASQSPTPSSSSSSQQSNGLTIERSLCGRRGRGENRKCRKVYGMERRDMWCTQCKWKKACSRFSE